MKTSNTKHSTIERKTVWNKKIKYSTKNQKITELRTVPVLFVAVQFWRVPNEKH